MPTSADGPAWPVDTSVAGAPVVGDHANHTTVLEVPDGRHLGLTGHAAFATCSVLTPLPAPSRLTPAAARRVIAVSSSRSLFLSVAQPE